MAPGFNAVFWPFHNTQIVDAARAASTVPSDGGRLDPEDLGDQVVEALADQDGIRRYNAPDTVLRPQPGTIRTRKYRLKIPVKLREVLREWRRCVNVTYNEAIRIVNAVTRHAGLPDEKDLKAQLCNAHGAFVKKRPYLKSCPVATRRAAVAHAISSRQGLLTRHYNTAPHARPADPPFLSPASDDKDRKRGFALTFVDTAGTIKFDENESGIHGLQLQLCPINARQAMGSSCRKEDIHAQIRLRGQVQRRFLVNHCVAHGKNRNLFSPAHEFKIQFDRYGHWNFLFTFDVADPGPAPTQPSGPIVVTTDNPGVCNPHAIDQSNGTVVEVSNAQDAQRLEQQLKGIASTVAMLPVAGLNDISDALLSRCIDSYTVECQRCCLTMCRHELRQLHLRLHRHENQM